MNRTLNATYPCNWRKVSTTKTVTLTLKGWRKWLAILLRRPVTYDVEMTASAWVRGMASITLNRFGYLSFINLTERDVVYAPQLEWKGNVSKLDFPARNTLAWIRDHL